MEYKGNNTFHLSYRIKPPFMLNEITLSVIFLTSGKGAKLAPLKGVIFDTFIFNYTYT
jgi:hypothetical protein